MDFRTYRKGRAVKSLSDRLLAVAISGVVPADDQRVIADAMEKIERLREGLRLAVIALRAEVKHIETELSQ